MYLKIPVFLNSLLKTKLLGNEREAWVYSSLEIHVFTALLLFSVSRVRKVH